ncbi:MAG: molecular chaperone [Marinicaulis sp.]|nr:hypothetical protein [Marinicaulis sp.]NNE42528.1 molecular chaperone [Marinicaulis sp.]NNL88957.1 molecular chaperone [Marinicaulis sp.]
MRAVFLVVFCIVFAPISAQAGMELSPLRNVLDADNRSATFTVSNPSDRILHGRVSWIDLSATPSGYKPATVAARRALSAAPYFVVSPASFTLKPGSRVKIKVAMREGAKPPPGERRSHLLIETGAERTMMRRASNEGLQLDIGLGVSAPVILRGRGTASANIGGTKLLRDADGVLEIATEILPTGALSTYGRMIVDFAPADEPGIRERLALRNNVAGYPDAERREVIMPLGYYSLGAGEIIIRYEGASEFEGKLFEERKFDIAPPAE